MNTDHLVEFLQTLEADESHTFYFSGIHPDGRRIQAYGTLEEMLPRLVERNNQGFGIFTCINAITPVVDEHGIARRKAAQVTRVRAVFCDWDDIRKDPPAMPLEPSIIVSTSPGKYHIYWLTDDLPLDQFERVQRGIAQYMGSDASVIDLSREMRLPGFLQSKEGYVRGPVRLLLCRPERRYGADEILGAFPYRATQPKFNVWDGAVRPAAKLTAAVIEHFYGPARTDGAFNMRCPWESSHTTPSNATSTIYYPPAEDNGGKGYFKCLHNHCQERYADHLDAWIAERIATVLA